MDTLIYTHFDDIVELREDSELFCYSGYFINKSEQDFSDWLGKEFSKSSEIKSFKKKKTTQYLLNVLKERIDTLKKSNTNFQYFINKNESYFFKLNDNHITILNKYIKKEIIIKKDYSFHLDYWKDLYFNEKFLNAYVLDKNDKFTHYSFTETKFQQRDSFPYDLFTERNEQWRVEYFIMTKDNKKNKIMEKLISLAPFVELSKNPSFGYDSIHEQLKFTHGEIRMRKQISLLKTEFEKMETASEYYIFGNDIIKAIKNYEVEKIFCFSEFKTKIEKNIDKEMLNFKWFVFENKKNEEDVVMLRLKDFKGIIAKRYYI